MEQINAIEDNKNTKDIIWFSIQGFPILNIKTVNAQIIKTIIIRELSKKFETFKKKFLTLKKDQRIRTK